jgi:hypothetical protein
MKQYWKLLNAQEENARMNLVICVLIVLAAGVWFSATGEPPKECLAVDDGQFMAATPESVMVAPGTRDSVTAGPELITRSRTASTQWRGPQRKGPRLQPYVPRSEMLCGREVPAIRPERSDGSIHIESQDPRCFISPLAHSGLRSIVRAHAA